MATEPKSKSRLDELLRGRVASMTMAGDDGGSRWRPAGPIGLVGCGAQLRIELRIDEFRRSASLLSLPRARAEDWSRYCELVLFDEALQAFDVEASAARARRSGIRLCGVVVSLEVSRLVRWLELGSLSLLSSDALKGRLTRAATTASRPTVEFDAWCRVRGGGRLPSAVEEARGLFLQLPHLTQLNVTAWSAANELDRFAFRRHVKRLFGRTPAHVLRGYLELACQRLREDGRTYAEIANVLDYSGASALHRAVKHRSS